MIPNTIVITPPPAHPPPDPFPPDAYDVIDDDELTDLLAAVPAPVVLPVVPQPDVQGAQQGNDDDNNDNDNDNNDHLFPEITDEEGDEEEDDYHETGAYIDPTEDETGANTEDHDIEVQEVGAYADNTATGAAAADNNLKGGAQPPQYNLRDRRAPPDRLREAMDNPHDSKSYHAPVQLLQQGSDAQGLDAQCRYIFGWVMNQMTAKAGLVKHGKSAEEALLKEFMQQRDLDVYEILDPLSLTKEQRQAALRAINLLKEKRNGDLKGRTVADGRKQRPLYTKAETASPTVSTVALMLTIMIDAYERRDVATADVAGAYLKAKMDDFVLTSSLASQWTSVIYGTGLFRLCYLRERSEGSIRTSQKGFIWIR